MKWTEFSGWNQKKKMKVSTIYNRLQPTCHDLISDILPELIINIINSHTEKNMIFSSYKEAGYPDVVLYDHELSKLLPINN